MWTATRTPGTSDSYRSAASTRAAHTQDGRGYAAVLTTTWGACRQRQRPWRTEETMKDYPSISSRVRFKGNRVVGPCVGTVEAHYEDKFVTLPMPEGRGFLGSLTRPLSKLQRASPRDPLAGISASTHTPLAARHKRTVAGLRCLLVYCGTSFTCGPAPHNALDVLERAARCSLLC